MLDGVGQVLLLRDLRPSLGLRLPHGLARSPGFVQFINRAKDELVTPDDFDAFVAEERARLRGPLRQLRRGRACASRPRATSQPLREVRGAYAGPPRQRARRGRRRAARVRRPTPSSKAADREARRTIAGDGRAHSRNQFARDDHARIDALADDVRAWTAPPWRSCA